MGPTLAEACLAAEGRTANIHRFPFPPGAAWQLGDACCGSGRRARGRPSGWALRPPEQGGLAGCGARGRW